MNPALARLLQCLPEILQRPGELPSPCQSVCVMDESRAWCSGCLRTLPEIAAWGALDAQEKRTIWLQIQARSKNLPGVYT